MTAIIDRDGRVFGRFNLFDAALVAFVVVLIPVAYFAYLLFRVPAPRITSVQPAQLTYIEDRVSGGTELKGKLKVTGTGLRPILRAAIGGQAVVAFIFETPTSADVLFGNMAPGTYDLILYDGVQEVARAPNSVVVPTPPKPETARVRALGYLVDLDDAAVRTVRVGARFPSTGAPQAEITALGDPVPDVRTIRMAGGTVAVDAKGRWQRPASVLIDCEVSVALQCRIGGTPVQADGMVIDVPGTGGSLKLRIAALVPATPPAPAVIRVRFLAPADAVDLMKAGDRDESAPALDERAATIVSIERRELVPGNTSLAAASDGVVPLASLSAADRVAAIDATVRLGADRGGDGMQYRLQPLAVGRSIVFTTARYTLRGLVRSITIANESAAERR
jgi:hypothetical protein